MQNFRKVPLCILIFSLLPLGVPAQSIWQKIKQQAAEAQARAKAAQGGKATAAGQTRTAASPAAERRGAVNDGPLGTPDLTAKLASSLPGFSVAGVKLGMSVRDAMTALKTHNGILTATPLPITFELIPNQQLLTGVDANEPVTSNASHEEVHLAFTMAPNAPVVDAILRNVYYPEGTRPTLKQAVQAMSSAYGPASVPPHLPDNNPEYEWVYDSTGKQLSGAQVANMPKNCADSVDVVMRARDAAHIVANGYQIKSDFDGQKHNETCAPYTVLKVILRTENGQAGDKLIALMVASAVSDPLLRSASQATHAQYLAAQQVKDQSDKNADQQNKATF